MKSRFQISIFACLLVFTCILITAQTRLLSAQMAETAMTRVWADSPNGPGIPPKWVYDYGVILNGMKTLWQTTGDKQYYDFI